MRSQYPEWEKQIKTGRCKERQTPDCADIRFSLIEVDLGDLQKQEREQLLYVPTSLELPPATVDLLKQAGRNLLRRSEAYQQLLKQIH